LSLVWYLLAAASAGVFLHAGIKYPWFVFFQKDSGLRPPDPPLPMLLAMVLFAALCIGLGIWYEPLYALLPFPATYVPYTGAHVVGQLQLLLFSGLAFFLMLPALRRTLTITLDADWLYRKLAPALVRVAGGALAGADRAVRVAIRAIVSGGVDACKRGASGNRDPSRTLTSGGMVLWVAVMLAAYLIAYYF
jgi:multicomponent Na+:H+ antiporter subunit D